MNTSDESSDDRLVTVLGPKQGGAGNTDLRAALWDRTTRVLRRRRRLRQGAMGAALAACYLAGIATTLAWWAARPVSPAAAGRESPTVAVAPGPDETAPEPGAVRPDVVGPAAPLTPFEQYRREGDRFLGEPAHLALAVRSYTKALGVASTEERAPSPTQDSWLLMALKDARFKETNHGNVE